ncbi:MAG TPA: DUF72 domain-containing protein [Gemmatimonadales bacterium]
MPGAILIGTQGWNYSAWVGPFYPVGTRTPGMLRKYAEAFDTVEIDSTFYAIPAEPVVRGWRERVPEHFVFSLKVPQEITHERRLIDAQPTLERFLQRLSLLGPHLGVLLLQMAPDWAPNVETRVALREFCEMLPAAYRWAIEFRDPGWFAVETLDVLRERNVALVLADGRWVKRDWMLEMTNHPTADFAYVRWMGPDRHISDYSHVQVERDAELDEWARGLTALAARVRTVFGYCNNHYQGHSPQTARGLQRRLGQTPVEPAALREQVEFF